jgi:hypothetical protein
MKKTLVTMSLTGLFFAGTSVMAAGNTNTGCGLGSVLIENQDSLVMQLLAVTTNGTSGNQTFGITSGTLNCAAPANIVMNVPAQEFVASNMDSIAVDIAAGQGESLDTLLSLVNVEDKDKAIASATLKDNFSNIYTSSDVTSAQVVDNIVATL